MINVWPGPHFEMALLAARLADHQEARDYAWLLGAGASKSSGIPLAGEMLSDAKRELYESLNGHPATSEAKIESWLASIGKLQDPEHAYSDALQWLLPRQRQRRRWLTRYLENAKPSPGYLGLAGLVRQKLMRAVLTTNFDDLIKQAVDRGDYGERVREITHSEAAADIEWPPQVFTVFKLHGDFLFDSMRNVQAELEQLPETQAEKLRRCARDGGLVVVGYSGGDESVMSVLENLDDAPLGLYWLHRDSDVPNSRVSKLLEKPWAMPVQIEGFDEFVAMVSARASAVGRAPVLEPTSFSSASSGRFIKGEKVDELLKRIDTALRRPSEQVCAIVGLPGMGKTALANYAAKLHVGDFEQLITLSAQRRALDLAQLLDAARRELSLPAFGDPSQTRSALLQQLSMRRVLLVLDNLEEVSQEIGRLLSELPSPSRALITVRDPSGLRAVGVAFSEVRHEGLSADELSEILKIHAEASPRIKERIEALGDDEVGRVMRALKGWPQALMLVIGELDDPLADVSSSSALLAGGDIVQRLLRDGYDDLGVDAKKVLAACAAFPATLTLDGARSVASLSRTRAANALSTLIERRWLSELATRTFSYAHPLVEEFVRSLRDRFEEVHRRRASAHIMSWLERYGGQPDPNWLNFRELDREFENIRAALEDALDEGALKRMTELMQPAFPYAVERGYWSWTDQLARRVLAVGPSAALAADWLVWRSWLALYLLEDPGESARLAEAALATGTNRVRARFEAHRRALTALSRIKCFARARHHSEQAEKLRPKLGRRDSDAAIDLLNAQAAIDVAEGAVNDDLMMLRKGLARYREAHQRCASRQSQNTREMGVALIGQARALFALGESEQALEIALSAVNDAAAIGWLRGQEDGNRLVAELADELERPDMASSARAFAERTGALLRRVA